MRPGSIAALRLADAGESRTRGGVEIGVAWRSSARDDVSAGHPHCSETVKLTTTSTSGLTEAPMKLGSLIP